MSRRITAPINALMMSATMPIPRWMPSRGKSQSPIKAPTRPTIKSPTRPKPPPSITLPANHPATIPTTTITKRLSFERYIAIVPGASADNVLRLEQFPAHLPGSRRLSALLRDRDQRPQNPGGAFQPLGRRVPFVEEHDLHVRADASAFGVLGDVGDQAFGIGEDVVAQREHRAFRADFDALDIGAPAQRFNADDLEKMLHLLGQRAEAVDQFGAERLDVAVVLELGEAAVEREPYRQIGDIVLGDEDRSADGDLRRPFVGDRCADAGLERHHRLFQHLLIELVADFLDVAGLLVSKQVAGAADVEIVRGKLEAGAERRSE